MIVIVGVITIASVLIFCVICAGIVYQFSDGPLSPQGLSHRQERLPFLGVMLMAASLNMYCGTALLLAWR